MKTKGVNIVNPAHLYEQIVEDLRAKIVGGELRPGDKIDTQAELARKYDVSLITVKNALTMLVNEGLLLSRAGKGTFVLKTAPVRANLGSHKTIGLVLQDLNHPYFTMIVQSIEARAYEMGFNVLVSGSGDMIKEEKQIEKFRAIGVDGLVIASLSLEYRATDNIRKLHAADFPYVMVSYIHDPDFWYVGSDHELGGYLATEHLLKAGYRTVGYVHMGGKNLLSEVRKNGYSRALMDLDIPYESDFIFTLDPSRLGVGSDRFQLGHSFAREFEQLPRKPEALFFYNDMTALGFIQGASERGIRVPDDVAVVGFDDTTFARFASVPLTTIHQPVDKIGSSAVDVIQKRMEKADISKRTIFKPTLVVRESCGARKRSAEKSNGAIALRS